MKDNDIEVYKDALATYGFDNQLLMVMEEVGEMLNVLAKFKRGRSTVDEIVTELADAHIMIEQMAYCFGITNFEAEKGKKVERLKKRLEIHKKKEFEDKIKAIGTITKNETSS